MSYKIIRICDAADLIPTASAWFNEKWGVPREMYAESMTESLTAAAVPQWYVAGEGGRIVGGLGVIEHDFHDRPDLAPNVCAVFVEPEHRRRGIAGALLDRACRDMAERGVDTLYLNTSHVGFYERYDWEFFCMARGDGEDHLSRMYVHRMK